MKASQFFRAVVASRFFLILAVGGAHAATRTWDGGGANVNWSNATNWVGDVAPVAGDDLVFPAGASGLSNSNNFSAGTTFNSINLSGTNYILNGNSIALNAGISATNGVAITLNNPLVLNSNQSCTVVGVGNFTLAGTIDLNGKDLTFAVTAPSLAQVQSPISGAGGLIKTGSGTTYLYASNNFSGPVQVNGGFLNVAHNNALGATNGSTTVSNGATLTLVNPITVPEPFFLFGILNSSGGSTKTLTGPISLGVSNAAVQVGASGTLFINGTVSGTGGMTKTLTGALILNGTNIYTGPTLASAGTLRVNGSQLASPITVSTATLGGTGTVSTVNVNSGGTIAPGNNGPGILTCSNATLFPANFVVDLNGTTPGTGYDQLNVAGSVSLTNVGLAGTVGFTPTIGDTFVIINNDGNDAVAGTFSSLPEGTYLSLGGKTFLVSYVGGTGNDVVLLRTNAPPVTFTSMRAFADRFVIEGSALRGLSYNIEAATNLNPVVAWTPIGTVVANSLGVIQFPDTNAPPFPMRFYRAVSP